jgi:hypothetical protein
MSSESVCQVARSWVDVGSFHMRLIIIFMSYTSSVRNILDIPSYIKVKYFLFSLLRIKGLYKFRALLAYPQEALHKRYLVSQ